MEDNNSSFQENIRNSFSKVKSDIDSLAERVNSIENTLKELKNENLESNSKINQISEILIEIKADLKDLKKTQDSSFFGSTGNKGVTQQTTTNNNKQQQTTTNNNKPQQQATTSNKQQPKEPQNPNPREIYLENIFKNLTDREFSTFVAAYEIAKERGEATFELLAERLNLTEAHLRGLIGTLINKKAPLEKERIMHGKVSLFIRKDFDSSTMERIMNKRIGDNSIQEKLYD